MPKKRKNIEKQHKNIQKEEGKGKGEGGGECWGGLVLRGWVLGWREDEGVEERGERGGGGGEGVGCWEVGCSGEGGGARKKEGGRGGSVLYFSAVRAFFGTFQK